MIIDCQTCVARPVACADCVVQAILAMPAEGAITEEEMVAFDALASSGLLSPLRYVSSRRAG